MTKLFLYSGCLIAAALLGSLVTASICYKKWQETRWILENTYLQTDYLTQGNSLEYFTNLFEQEISKGSKRKIEFVYISSDLRHRMPITNTYIGGTLFFSLTALEHTYGCSFELAESSVIVRQAPTEIKGNKE